MFTSQATLTRQQLLAHHVLEYGRRTGRKDGLDFIRDELARYGVKRFSQIDDDETRVKITLAICTALDTAK